MEEMIVSGNSSLALPDSTDIIVSLKESINILKVQADELKIITEEDYEASGHFASMWVAMDKVVDGKCDPRIAIAHKAHKEELKIKGGLISVLSAAREKVEAKRKVWRDEDDRKRLVREAEEREKARRVAEERRKADEDRAIAEASELEKQGQSHLASIVMQEAIEAPIHTPAVVLPSSVPKQSNASVSKPWKHRVTNAALVPHEYRKCEPDDALLRQKAKSTQGPSTIPGVEFYQEDQETWR